MYTEIKDLDDRIDSLEREILDLEASVTQNSMICLDNVTSWLMEADFNEEPQVCFDRLIFFDEQLRSDHKKFVSHANERFFARECRVNDNLTLKEKSQVMLLYNLEISHKLANGSRGVVEGFVETDEYMNLITAIMKFRDKNMTHLDKGDKNNVDKAKEDVALILSGLEKGIIMELVGCLKIMNFINDELTKVEREVKNVRSVTVSALFAVSKITDLTTVGWWFNARQLTVAVVGTSTSLFLRPLWCSSNVVAENDKTVHYDLLRHGVSIVVFLFIGSNVSFFLKIQLILSCTADPCDETLV